MKKIVDTTFGQTFIFLQDIKHNKKKPANISKKKTLQVFFPVVYQNAGEKYKEFDSDERKGVKTIAQKMANIWNI